MSRPKRNRSPVFQVLEPRFVMAAQIFGPRPGHMQDWIVQLKDESLSSSIASVGFDVAPKGVEFETKRSLGTRTLFEVRTYSVDEQDAIDAFQADPRIFAFSQNSVIRGGSIPNDADFPNQIGLHNVGQFGAKFDADIDALEAWEINVGTPSVVVGVIDSGIDLIHPDLYLNIWINQGEIPLSIKAGLTDADQDGLFTFYDLNNPVNAELVRDVNRNQYIDADDLLQDPRWADGFDTDGNEYVDDLFGWNFRTGSNEPFAPNNPSDSQGHGTHVAGIIGAIGDNAIGTTGVNRKTSLMALKFLDENNRGDLASAIAAINYAKTMRTRFQTNVRVLNASWGQAGESNPILQETIFNAGEAGMLLIAAAGNGNVLGQGIDNDRTPFFPASYSLSNVIAVGASDANDNLASFSNFGASSVHIVAPGVAIKSTLPNGSYGEANGTSMAAPFVSGTAALLWSEYRTASLDEIRQAILENTDELTNLQGIVSRSGRLNADRAIRASSFSPQANLVDAPNIVTESSDNYRFQVRFEHRNGIDVSSLDNKDFVVRSTWGEVVEIPVRLMDSSIRSEDSGRIVYASYELLPRGGFWDPLDYGTYQIILGANEIMASGVESASRSQIVGQFQVRIEKPNVIYVVDPRDHFNEGSLRHAIGQANAEPATAFTIILETNTYQVSIPPNTLGSFVTPPDSCTSQFPDVWSDPWTGDLEVYGNVSIFGSSSATTVIRTTTNDRVFRVHPDGTLRLFRTTIAGGVGSALGGGIINAGSLAIHQSTLTGNSASELSQETGMGGAILSLTGTVEIVDSRLHGNSAAIGGGALVCGDSELSIRQSSVDNNLGGGVVSFSSQSTDIANSTIALNIGEALGSRERNLAGGDAPSSIPKISGDGQSILFLSESTRLSESDSNNAEDIFFFDRRTNRVRQISVSSQGDGANRASSQLSVSRDGSQILFISEANNLVAPDDLFSRDLFLHDLNLQTTVRLSPPGVPVREVRGQPSQSSDGNTVAFQNVTPDDPNNAWGVFLWNKGTNQYEAIPLQINNDFIDLTYLDHTALSGDGRYLLVMANSSGTSIDEHHDMFLYDVQNRISRKLPFRNAESVRGSYFSGSISHTGRFIAFVSDDPTTVQNDTNGVADVFLYDVQQDSVRRISQRSLNEQSNAPSYAPSISADGRYVAFASTADNLVPTATDGRSHIFVADTVTGEVSLVSANTDGVQADGDSFYPSISDDGRYVTFQSTARNLLRDIPSSRLSGESQIYVVDRWTGEVQSVSAFYQTSNINVAQSTIAANQATYAVTGNVRVQDSLFFANNSAFDWDTNVVSLGNNLLSSVPSLGNLQNTDQRLPSAAMRVGEPAIGMNGTLGFPLLSGSPAIGNANPTVSQSEDQWGRRRVSRDIGAIETVTGNLSGQVFADLNGNGVQDNGEPSFLSSTVFLDANRDGIPQRLESQTSLQAGVYAFTDIPPGTNQVRVVVPTNWTASDEPIQRLPVGTIQPNGASNLPVVGRTGRTVAFTSFANNLVENVPTGFHLFVSRDGQIERVPTTGSNLRVNDIGGTNEELVFYRTDLGLYAYDLFTKQNTLLSVTNSGSPADGYSEDAAISEDGRWVVYSSFAKNLVPGDVDNNADIFLFDRSTGQVDSVTRAALGFQGDFDSLSPSISNDGRYVVFMSDATNLVTDDTNGVGDIFLYDREDNSIKLVSRSAMGTQSNASSLSPRLSRDGSTIVFQSLASNLVNDDNNGSNDLFTVDVSSLSINKLDIPFRTNLGFQNLSPTISGDGQYIVFVSNGLTTSTTTSIRDVFVYDRMDGGDATSGLATRLRRISNTFDGSSNNGNSNAASISSDGGIVVFDSFSTKLISGDTNQRQDVFKSPNPFESNARLVDLVAGDRISMDPIGLTPDSGIVRGTVYYDIDRSDSLQLGESLLANWIVYFDLNNNQRRDSQEPFQTTSEDGIFSFVNVPSYREYYIRAESQLGWEASVVSSSSTRFFLPAGGEILQRDLGFIPQTTQGQSSNSSIEGRVFFDLNQNGKQDVGEPGRANLEVYLDLNRNERRDFDEPRTITNSLGEYRFTGLGPLQTAVRVNLNEGLRTTTPIGNRFQSSNTPFTSGSSVLSNPQDIVVGDFDGQNGMDLAIAMVSANQVSMLLNDGAGGFQSSPVLINIGPNGKGPIAMAAGDLNKNGTVDLVVVNAFNSTATILIDFNGSGFTRTTTIPLAVIPTQVAIGDLNGDSNPDLIFLGQLIDGTGRWYTFINDGVGQFTSAATGLTGGKRPVSSALRDFNQDNRLDLAIAHMGDGGRAGDNGSVSILLGTGVNSFLAPTRLIAGNAPSSIDAADLSKDGALDLVVTNFGSNTATIFQGFNDGRFESRAQISLGLGPIDLSLVDVNHDGDIDIVSTSLTDNSVSIVRNRQSQQSSSVPDSFVFDATETFAVAQLVVGDKLAFVAGDINGSGTIDFAFVVSSSNQVNIRKNSLINGAHRVSLTGSNSVRDLLFGLRAEVVLPTLDPISGPTSVLEDTANYVIPLTGISAGVTSGPPLRWTITSSNLDVIPVPQLGYTNGATSGTLTVSAVPNVSGTSVIRVRLENAGADGVFDTVDDGRVDRSWTMTVLPVNDPPTVRLAGDQVVTVGTNLRTVPLFATNFDPGGGSYEESQRIQEFIVSTPQTDLFRVQPHIDNNGTLRYQPNLDRTGTAIVSVQVRDNGGIENGGRDRSVVQTFQIIVTDLADGDFDFGDSPLPYRTLLAQDGARHRISSLFLGTGIDAELDGQPNSDATGDGAFLNDEDGVLWVSTLSAHSSISTVSSVVIVSSDNGLLDAWIDFNQDGDWLDSGEQIFANRPVEFGRNLLSFTIPAGAKSGNTFSRFRLSSAGGLSSTGLAEDGEVEDYRINLVDGTIGFPLEMMSTAIGDHELRLENGFLIARSGGLLTLSVPHNLVSSVRFMGEDPSPIYSVASPSRNLIGTVYYQSEPLMVSLHLDTLNNDLTTLENNVLQGFQRIELTSPAPQTLRIDSRIVAQMRSNLGIRVSIGADDRILSNEVWRLSNRFREGMGVVHEFRASTNGVRVETTLATAWQNPLNPLDVDGDGLVTPLDVLAIINFINMGASSLPEFDPLNPLASTFSDVNGNNSVEPLDVLAVINAINSVNSGGEGERRENEIDEAISALYWN
ncbi:MAG: S8 family serine peptidase [Pirellula sp.]